MFGRSVGRPVGCSHYARKSILVFRIVFWGVGVDVAGIMTLKIASTLNPNLEFLTEPAPHFIIINLRFFQGGVLVFVFVHMHSH